MTKKSPIAAYFLTLISGGIYFFFWMFNLMKEINTQVNEKIFDTKEKAIKLLSVLIANLVLFIIMGYAATAQIDIIISITFALEFILILAWFILIIKYIRQLSDQILQIEIAQGNINPISKNTATFLFFIYLTAIPYIQSHMNKIVESNFNTNIQFKNSKLKIISIVSGVILVIILFGTGLFIGISQMIKNDDSYKTAIKYIESQEKISSYVGVIVAFGNFPTANVEYSNGYGNAQFEIKVKGREKDLNILIELRKIPDCDWSVEDIQY